MCLMHLYLEERDSGWGDAYGALGRAAGHLHRFMTWPCPPHCCLTSQSHSEGPFASRGETLTCHWLPIGQPQVDEPPTLPNPGIYFSRSSVLLVPGFVGDTVSTIKALTVQWARHAGPGSRQDPGVGASLLLHLIRSLGCSRLPMPTGLLMSRMLNQV